MFLIFQHCMILYFGLGTPPMFVSDTAGLDAVCCGENSTEAARGAFDGPSSDAHASDWRGKGGEGQKTRDEKMVDVVIARYVAAQTFARPCLHLRARGDFEGCTSC